MPLPQAGYSITINKFWVTALRDPIIAEQAWKPATSIIKGKIADRLVKATYARQVDAQAIFDKLTLLKVKFIKKNF